MKPIPNINAWIMAVLLLLVGSLAACVDEEATSTSPPVAEPAPTDTPSPEPVTGEEKTVYVGPILVDCEGEGPQKCMLVKETPDGTYGLF